MCLQRAAAVRIDMHFIWAGCIFPGQRWCRMQRREADSGGDTSRHKPLCSDGVWRPGDTGQTDWSCLMDALLCNCQNIKITKTSFVPTFPPSHTWRHDMVTDIPRGEINVLWPHYRGLNYKINIKYMQVQESGQASVSDPSIIHILFWQFTQPISND